MLVQVRGTSLCFVTGYVVMVSSWYHLAQNPKLEYHLLSVVPDCFFNTFAAIFNIGARSSIRNLRKHHAVVTGAHYHGY